jgi:hypothetical protein
MVASGSRTMIAGSLSSCIAGFTATPAFKLSVHTEMTSLASRKAGGWMRPTSTMK